MPPLPRARGARVIAGGSSVCDDAPREAVYSAQRLRRAAAMEHRRQSAMRQHPAMPCCPAGQGMACDCWCDTNEAAGGWTELVGGHEFTAILMLLMPSPVFWLFRTSEGVFLGGPSWDGQPAHLPGGCWQQAHDLELKITITCIWEPLCNSIPALSCARCRSARALDTTHMHYQHTLHLWRLRSGKLPLLLDQTA